MLTTLYRAAAVWTGLGLASGLFYREFTKFNDVAGGTQLAVVHTHTLVLGTVVMLLLLALVGVWRQLEASRAFRVGVRVWQVGLGITAGSLLVKGCLQVLKSPTADSAAIAGISGLGHITLTVAFVFLFVGLGRVLRVATAGDATRSGDAVPSPQPLAS